MRCVCFTAGGRAFNIEDKLMISQQMLDQVGAMTDREFQVVLDTLFPGQEFDTAAGLQKPDIGNIRFRNGAYHAMSANDVKILVTHARAAKLRLRVAGSGHSADSAVYSQNTDDLRIVLDGELRSVQLLSHNASGALVRRRAVLPLRRQRPPPQALRPRFRRPVA